MFCCLVFVMPKRRTFGHFLASSEDNFLLKRRTCPPKRGRMVSLSNREEKYSIFFSFTVEIFEKIFCCDSSEVSNRTALAKKQLLCLFRAAAK